MRALIMIAAACLSLAACGDRVDRDDNAFDIANEPVDSNWRAVNTDQAEGNQSCEDPRKCDRLPDDTE